MKIIVKNEQGKKYALVVHPQDTFHDIQNRLYENNIVLVNVILEKLALPDKPFDLSENVMKYFGIVKKKNTGNVEETQCSSNSIQSVISEHSDSLENIQENVLEDDFIGQEVRGKMWSELDLTQNYEMYYKDGKSEDNYPGEEVAEFNTDDLNYKTQNQISEECDEESIKTKNFKCNEDHVISDDGEEQDFKNIHLEGETAIKISVLDENKTTGPGDFKYKSEQFSQEGEKEETLNNYPINLENISSPGGILSEPMPLCRLCAQEIYDDNLVYIHNVISSDGTTLVDKINACLPITVSLTDKLPKQICSECLISLDFSYIFSQTVTSAEESLHTLQLSTNEEHLNCPLCCEGYMETQLNPDPTDTQDGPPQPDPDDTVEDTSVVEPPPVSVEMSQIKKRKRPKKSDDCINIDENDSDYTLEETLEPPKKKSSQRGRPKGSKNKYIKPKNLSCFICYAKFQDYNEALVHASAHCDDVNETYPCPLCQSILTSEHELIDHIDTHNNKREVVIIQCGLCGVQASQATEIHKHVLQHHFTSVEEHYTCPLCQHVLPDADQVVTHVIQDHVDHTTNNCPICFTIFSSTKELKQHLADNHIEEAGKVVFCSECGLTADTKTDYLNHIVDQHCTSTKYKVPAQYSCYTCKNKFRSQYSLVKHTCNIAIQELFCKECNQVFPTKARFVFHLNTHQPNFAGLRCDQCWKVFTDENTFYDHVRFQHEPDEQIECEECNKVFKNELSLSMHMRRHQSNRDHKCPECGKRFLNAQTLREHQVSHMTIKPYQCHICGAYLSRLSRLRIHLRTHSVKSSKASMKAYKCSVCTQLFPNTKDAFKHIEGHSEENINLEELEVSLVFRCEYCDACFQQTSELQKHRKVKHPNPGAHNAFTCSVCGAQFSTYARVTTHKLTHGITTESLIVPDEVNKGEESFVIPQFFLCHECDKQSVHYTYLNLHRRYHHAAGKPIFPCDLCGEKFATSWSLTFHKKKQHQTEDDKLESEPVGVSVGSGGNRHSINTLYHCPECDKPYMTETSLEMHIKKCHQDGHNADSNSNFICETCGKTFQFKTALDAHADAHKGLKRFECETCDRRFTHRAGLIRHMKLHSDDDPLVCEFCGKKFRDRTERENHRRAHTGERPFMCEVCGRTFHTRAVWLDHSRIHQNFRPYQCDICNQSFRRSYALKSHYLIHTGEKPFACEVCGKTFRLKQTLFAHNKKECQRNYSSQTVLPNNVLLIEENSQFADDDGLSDVDTDSLLTRTFLNRSGEMMISDDVKVPTSELLNSANIIKQASPWKIDTKPVIVRKTKSKILMKDRSAGDDSLSQQRYSLLLKSNHMSLGGTH